MDDRISTLPDPILCHILSFLPTKQTVATSVLSKRWKPLWRSVPVLDFDDEEPDDIGTYFLFVQSVYAVIVSLDLHQPIHRFRLSCVSDNFYDPYNVTIWVNAAVQRRVQHIELCVYPPCLQPSPNLSSIFTCSTLMVLKLQGMKLEGLPSAVDLPLLKVLHLEDLTISEFKSLAELLSGCPNLEDLKTMGLFITCYESYREIKTLPKLVRADVSLESTYVLFRDVVENVKFLHLDEIYDVVLNESARQYPDFIPMFHNLTRIELVYCKFNSDCSEVVELLNHCPKLQDLVIDQPNIESDLFEEPLQYPSSVLECILSHLQRCYINCYRGTKGEFRFAKYIMENGRFLKTMTISSGIARNPQRKRKMLKELSSCTRQSETCKLSFK